VTPQEIYQQDRQQAYNRHDEIRRATDPDKLDDVLFHEDHVHRPDVQYGGSERLGESKQ
jgi:hypothetical protein